MYRLVVGYNSFLRCGKASRILTRDVGDEVDLARGCSSHFHVRLHARVGLSSQLLLTCEEQAFS